MEAPFLLMSGRDPYIPLNQLVAQARRYLSTEESIPDLDTLKNPLQMTTTQIQHSYKEESKLQTFEAT